MAQDSQPNQIADLAQYADNRNSSPHRAQMLDEASRLSREYSAACAQLKETEVHGGPLAKLVDYAKNNWGADPKSPHFFASVWGEIIDQTQGSQALEKEADRDKALLSQLQRNADLGQEKDFSQAYKRLTHADFIADRVASQKLLFSDKVAWYQRSQVRMVDSIGDGCGALAATLAQWKFKKSNLAPIVAAGLTKALVKSTEPLYGNAKRDLVTGSLDGLAIVLAGRLGSRTNAWLGEAPTGKSARLHFLGKVVAIDGVGGAIFGAVTGPVREYFSAKDSKTPVTVHDLTHAAVRDAKTGFVLGLPFGVRF